MEKISHSSSTLDRSNLRAMVYNDEEAGGDFSKILGWLGTRNNVITSIVDGEWTDSFGRRDKFLIGDSTAFVGMTSDELFQKSLNTLGGQDEKKLVGPDEKLSRTESLTKVMDGIKAELCMAESIASRVPLWQILEHDLPLWSLGPKMGPDDLASLPFGNTLVLIQLDQRSYSLTDLLQRYILPAVYSDHKLVLAAATSTPQDYPCILPVAYLIEALNAAKIRRTPIDLLLLDRGQVEEGRLWDASLSLLSRKSLHGPQIYLGGDLNSFRHLSLHLVQGDFIPARAKGIHFVVDSSADVHTAMESISSKVWTSGTQVIPQARSLLLVHQSIYGAVIEGFGKKVKGLRILEEAWAAKKADFIKRSSIIDPRERLCQGAKVISTTDEADFAYPSLVYDIGTSASLVTSPIPGSGHILVVIPYRSVSELLALANNFDVHNETFLFASNVNFFTSVAAGLKAKSVVLNTTESRREPRGESGGFALVSGKINSEIEKGGRSETDDKWIVDVAPAVKALKTWSALSLEARTVALEPFLRRVIQSERRDNQSERRDIQSESRSILSESRDILSESRDQVDDGLDLYADLLKVVSRMDSKECGGVRSAGRTSLSITTFQPVGVVGILFVNLGRRMSIRTRLLPILMSTVKGNVSIVMSVSNPDPNNLLATMQKAAAAASLPTGVVTFLHFPTMGDAKQWGLLDPSRFNLLWILQSRRRRGEEEVEEGDGENVQVTLEEISSCNRVIIDTETEDGTIPHLQRRLANLEIPKTIIF